MSYNGWSNYETWNTALWIDNEPGSYHEARGIVNEARSERDAENGLKEWWTDGLMADVNPAGPTADLLGAAISEINWQEIVQHYQVYE